MPLSSFIQFSESSLRKQVQRQQDTLNYTQYPQHANWLDCESREPERVCLLAIAVIFVADDNF